MGCDIHIFVQQLDESGEWVTIFDDKHRDFWPNFMLRFRERDYRLFGILADVRYPMGQPLFPRRGWPENTILDEWLDDYHSHTWFLISELVKQNWDSISSNYFEVKLYGDEYCEFLETGRLPVGWHLHCRFGETTDVSEDEMRLLLVAGRGHPKKRRSKQMVFYDGPVVNLTLPVTYRQEIPEFVNEIVPGLVGLGDPDKTRVLLVFDS